MIKFKRFLHLYVPNRVLFVFTGLFDGFHRRLHCFLSILHCGASKLRLKLQFLAGEKFFYFFLAK